MLILEIYLQILLAKSIRIAQILLRLGTMK
jgi:hypothetical protein